MVDWKALGEIPDSEDEEGFGSQQSEPQVAGNEDTPISDTAVVGRDIWEFPDSQNGAHHPPAHDSPFEDLAFILKTSSPLSSAPSVDKFHISGKEFQDTSDEDTVPAGRPKKLGNSPTSSSQNVFSTGIYSDSAGRDKPGFLQEHDVVHQNPRPAGHVNDEALRVAVRYERSLRPRKPIQEHPYLLESVQFSSTWKLHGLKPLRIATESEEKGREEQSRLSHDAMLHEDSQEYNHSPPATSFALDQEVLRFPNGLDASSTPMRPSPVIGRMGTSSPSSSSAGTDSTSLFDQDLPALDDLLSKPPKSSSAKTRKRVANSPKSSTRKRRRRTIIDSDPLEQEALHVGNNSASPTKTSFLLSPLRPSQLDIEENPPTLGQRLESTTIGHLTQQHKFYDVMSLSSDEDDAASDRASESDDPELLDSVTTSESEAEAVTAMGRRIRGVLPASWLRLDQQSGRNKAEKTSKNDHRPNRVSVREERRGVARRLLTALSNNSIPECFENLDAERRNLAPVEPDHADTPETRVSPHVTKRFITDDWDDDLVVEDNRVDYMISPQVFSKRQSRLRATEAERKKSTSNRDTRTPTRRLTKPQQSRLTSHLRQTCLRDAVSCLPVQKRRKRTTKTPDRILQNSVRKKKRRLQPKIGILDTIQLDAPRFLKIAARAAKNRITQGRSWPHMKIIQLATRQDQIDVVSVLNEWRSGSIKPRDSVTDMAKSLLDMKTRPVVLKESSGNQAGQGVAPPAKRTVRRKLVKEFSSGGSVRYLPSHSQSEASPAFRIRQSKSGHNKPLVAASARPAQLETAKPYSMTKSGFYSRKRLLDNLFRDSKTISVPSEPTPKPASDADGLSTSLPVTSPVVAESERLEREFHEARPRFRKRTLPKRLDISAPQYSHACDPVPDQYVADDAPTAIGTTDAASRKLYGLGPYGTQYTHNFEIFPLQAGVFFHESTFIGGGHLLSCFTSTLPLDWTEPRPLASMTLNSHVLKWGPWNAQISSEFGVVLDLIADQVEALFTQADTRPSFETTPVQAISFLLNYIKQSLCFADESNKSLFVSRSRECVHAFDGRIVSAVRATVRYDKQDVHHVLEMYDRLLLVALFLLRISRADPSLARESFPVEELIKQLAHTSMSLLMRLGLENLRSLYIELGSQDNCGSGGIRNDSSVIHSWIVNIRILAWAQIPRGSFWDLVQKHIAPDTDITSSNAQDHERVWQNLFTLLPLLEFSDSGVLVAGMRHKTVCQGWAIPQRLIKQIFQLYNENSRQAASFNSYCRALIGRCHFLVQEWAWTKCVAMVGLIFDFFGSNQLAHLRNEEVYNSPSFLDNLDARPTLHVQPEDRCFHVFLKLIAIAIRKLRDAGCLKDVGNLVTRTKPNHNRQHSKDETIHERDLAALRNHHDLLCTLFWAAPPEHRPSPQIIQHLVVPATSHKEACLINLRAWNQLSRYVIANGEVNSSWKAFHAWRNTFFDQILQEFNSVASNVTMQLATLDKEASRSISKEMVNTTIAVNKTALMDILYASVSASLDVVRRAPDLASATFAVNRTQMLVIFNQFSVATPELEWAILYASLQTLESLLTMIDDFKADKESQQSESQMLNSAVADDAVLALDQDLSQSFFCMARCVLSTRGKVNAPTGARRDHDNCVGQVVIVAARMSMRFVNGGLIRLSQLFSKGKYQLFNTMPHHLNLEQRELFTLFITTLLQYNIDDFEDAGLSLSELWMPSLVKPHKCLHYELRLAQELRRHGMRLVPDTVADLCSFPHYDMMHAFFEYSVSTMRKTLRDAGPTHQKALTADYLSALRIVMEQMRSDLRTTCQTLAEHEHDSYVSFVQRIITLIRTHASDICAVDNYFYRISKEYSPPAEDPQLRVASIVSYGLKLQDGDARSSRPLFYLLFNNAKFSIIHDKIDDQIEMLLKSMLNNNIKDFILCKMLPAVLNVAFVEPDAFPLLDIYLEVLRRRYAATVVSDELVQQDVKSICVLLSTVWQGISSIQAQTGRLTQRQLYLLRQVFALQNLLWPSIHVLSMSRPSPAGWDGLQGMLTGLWGAVCTAEKYLREVKANSLEPKEILGGEIFAEELEPRETGFGGDVQTFTENMIQDVRKGWKVTADTIWINWQGPNTRAPEGLTLAQWDPKDLANDLYDRIREWCWWWRRANGSLDANFSASDVF